MCNTNPNAILIPYGLKVPNPSPYSLPFGSSVSQMALDLQRAQFYDYSTRLQYGFRSYQNSLGLNPYHSHPGTDPYMHPYLYKDPRARYIHEEPKPNHSYIGLIAMAILSHRDHKLVLSEIYQWILDNYPYFRTRGPGWRNSIRHNLSLNDCFIKSGRSANGKGHYWAIHPANIEDFKKGDFRRRRAQRRVRKHMGLSVPDDDDSPSPSPTSTSINWDDNENINVDVDEKRADDSDDVSPKFDSRVDTTSECGDSVCNISRPVSANDGNLLIRGTVNQQTKSKKRLFDVESLLAPDTYSNKLARYSEMVHKSMQLSETDDDEAQLDVGVEVETEHENDEEAEDSKKCESVEFSEHSDACESNTTDNNSTTESANVSKDNSECGSSRDVKEGGPVTDYAGTCNTLQQTTNCVMMDSNGTMWRQGYKGYSMMASRPSAFHNARVCSWGSLTPYLSSYPVVGVKGHFPLVVPRANLAMDSATKWQETVTQLVSSRSEKTTAKVGDD